MRAYEALWSVDYNDEQKHGDGKSRDIVFAYANPRQEWNAVAETHRRA